MNTLMIVTFSLVYARYSISYDRRSVFSSSSPFFFIECDVFTSSIPFH